MSSCPNTGARPSARCVQVGLCPSIAPQLARSNVRAFNHCRELAPPVFPIEPARPTPAAPPGDHIPLTADPGVAHESAPHEARMFDDVSRVADHPRHYALAFGHFDPPPHPPLVVVA